MVVIDRTALQVLATGFVMIAAASLSSIMEPTQRLADQLPQLELEEAIPKSFANWEADAGLFVVQVSPDVLERLRKVYSDTLSRVYVNRRTGDRIMLSIAYGREQRGILAVHYPEVCYPAQGFGIASNQIGQVVTPSGGIPVRRLESVLKPRYEPITYWTTIGDQLSLGGAHKRLIELKYGLSGIVPDGLLVRVSSIERDSNAAFKKHDDFIRDMLEALPPTTRQRLIGGALN